jgi:hypothetical protein
MSIERRLTLSHQGKTKNVHMFVEDLTVKVIFEDKTYIRECKDIEEVDTVLNTVLVYCNSLNKMNELKEEMSK